MSGDADDAELVDAIRTVIRLARIAQQACEEVGLTLPQYRALNSAVRGRRRSFELAQYSAVSRPAMSALTTGLERLGHFERRTAEADGRGVYFKLTKQGRATLDAAERLLAERFDEVLGDALPSLRALDTEAIEAALDRQADRDFGPST